MPSPDQVVKKVVDCARKWANCRRRYRKMLDSKSVDKKDLEKAKSRLLKATDRLEIAVRELEIFFRGNPQPFKKQKKPFPWKEILGFAAAATNTANEIMNPRPQPPRTIDVEAKVTDVK